MEIHLKISGLLLVFLACIHVVFPRYFDWKNELAGLNLVNRQMMQVHVFFIALMLLLLGLYCVSSSGELVSTYVGKKFCLGMGIFWTTRLFVQFFGYSSLLWKGKVFETTIHILLSILWLYFGSVFFLIYFK